MNELYLQHHGILGQKWGVRRYQNADGTLTAAGKQRYGSTATDKEIKAYKKERSDYYYKNDERTKRLDDIENEAIKIALEYELDADDGGGGNRDKYTDEEISRASKKYMDLWEDYDILDNEIDDDIRRAVKSDLINKYGDERIQSFQTAQNIKAGAEFAGVVLGFIGATVLISKL